MIRVLMVGLCESELDVNVSWRTVATFSADQVMFIELGKFLITNLSMLVLKSLTVFTPNGEKRQGAYTGSIHDQHIVLAPQPKHKPALHQLFFPHLAKAFRIPTTKTQNSDIVSRLRAYEGHYRGGEEHSLIIRMGDK